jgi:hypothetical protein
MASVGLTIFLAVLGGAWQLSSKLTTLQEQNAAMKEQNDATQREVYRIEQHLHMPLPSQVTQPPPQSYTNGDPDLSRELQPLFPQTAQE